MKTISLFILIIIMVGLGISVIVYTSSPQNSQTEVSLASPSSAPTPQESYTHQITIGGNAVFVEVANTPEKMRQGLSGRASLSEGTGMLFIYQYPQTVVFWMPDMNFPIDIIYLRSKKIVSIVANVPNPPINTPKNSLPTYPSPEPIDMVLEVPAGWAKTHNLIRGSQLILDMPLDSTL